MALITRFVLFLRSDKNASVCGSSFRLSGVETPPDGALVTFWGSDDTQSFAFVRLGLVAWKLTRERVRRV